MQGQGQMTLLTGSFQPPLCMLPHASVRFRVLSSHSLHLQVPIPSYPLGRGSKPSEKTWEACGRAPTVPALSFPLYHMASEPFIQNDFETLLLIFLSLHFIPSHSPSSCKWKFQNPIWKKKKIAQMILGAGLIE